LGKSVTGLRIPPELLERLERAVPARPRRNARGRFDGERSEFIRRALAAELDRVEREREVARP
jgi:Arc/MetJ-type ribon-helix-helix transcriptional regulator